MSKRNLSFLRLNLFILTSSVVSGALLNSGNGSSVIVEFGNRLSNLGFGGLVSTVFFV
jgi:hypothetical protein